MKRQHIILMGPQGSGKGTQAGRVSERLGLQTIATGELFRFAIKDQTELGQQIKAIYDRGELVPDSFAVALVEERLDRLARDRAPGSGLRGVLYDGFPRTAPQAAALDRALKDRGEEVTAVIAIDVPRAALIERLAGRRVCANCTRVYNALSDAPTIAGICDTCGGEVTQRADDTPAAVAKRLDLYEVETAPLMDRYADRGLLVHINGDRPIDEVTQAIVSAIEARTTAAAGARR